MKYSFHNIEAQELVISFMLNMNKLTQLGELLKNAYTFPACQNMAIFGVPNDTVSAFY